MLDIPPSSDITGKAEDVLWQAHEEETAQIAGRRTISSTVVMNIRTYYRENPLD
jgi:hypothetical protein